MSFSEILPNLTDAVDSDTGDVLHVDDLVDPDAPGITDDDEYRYADEINAPNRLASYLPGFASLEKYPIIVGIEGEFPSVSFSDRAIALSALVYYINIRNSARGARVQLSADNSDFIQRIGKDASYVVDAMASKVLKAVPTSKQALDTLVDGDTLRRGGLSEGQVARERAMFWDDMDRQIGGAGLSYKRHKIVRVANKLADKTK